MKYINLNLIIFNNEKYKINNLYELNLLKIGRIINKWFWHDQIIG